MALPRVGSALLDVASDPARSRVVVPGQPGDVQGQVGHLVAGERGAVEVAEPGDVAAVR